MTQEFNKFTEIDQFRNCIKDVQYWHHARNEQHTPFPTLKFKGSTKIHGTNAAVALPENFAQSITQIITPENDNYGFAKFHDARKEIFMEIYNHIVNELSLPENTRIVVYGEWAGKGIQSGVGVSELNKSFFVFGVKVLNESKHDGHYWLDEWSIPTKLDTFNIYDTRQYKTWEIEIDFENPQLTQNQLAEWTLEVEANCPVAAFYNVAGIGEGIVWEHITEDGQKFSFKVKGEKHQSSKVKTLAPVDVEKLNSITEFVEYAVTESRLEQGWGLLFDAKSVTPDIKELGSFIKWVSGDIVKEESDTLETNELTIKDVGSVLSKKARTWFIAKLNNQ